LVVDLEEGEGAAGFATTAEFFAGRADGGEVALVATFPVFDIPPSTTVAFIGLWTLETGGTYGGCFDVTDEAFAGQGTYTLTAGTITL
jgi:hypothetical protein